MEIVVSQEQGRVPVTVFRVKGDLNAATFAELQRRAQEVIESGARHLLIDLSGVRYMSSAGMRALNQIYNWLEPRSAEDGKSIGRGVTAGTYHSTRLKLLNPTPRVLEVLKMTGFDMFLEIHRDIKDAVASFGPR